MEEQEKNIFYKFERMSLQIHTVERSNRTDEEYFRLFQEGEKENDISKIYDFVGGLERGGLDRPNKELADCFMLAWAEDECRTITILNGKSKVIDCVFLAYCMNEKIKLQLVDCPAVINAHLKFEIIRQLLRSKQIYQVSEMEKIAQGIIQLCDLDKDLFAFMIKMVENKKSFYQVMGKALNGISNEGLSVYANTIQIDKYQFNFHGVNEMLEEIAEDRRDHVFGSLHKPICKKWEDFLTSLFKTEEFLNDIVISSYSNLVLCCMIKKFENVETYFIELEHTLNTFEDHLFAWYTSNSRAMSVYFINITRLYMLKLAHDNLKISWENKEGLKNQLTGVLREALRYPHYWKYAGYKSEDILNWH